MEKNKAVLVEKNGKQLKYKLQDRTNRHSPDEEFAAALEESDESIPVLSGVNKYNASKKKKKSRIYFSKPMLFAILSAIIVGTVMGFAMLRIFVDVEAESDGQPLNNQPPITAANENASAEKASPFSMDPLEAYILQAGVFSEKENAEKWAAEYTDKGIETIIWNRDNQFYLLAGIAPTKEKAVYIADELKTGNSIDLFVKEWSTIAGEAPLNVEEQEWVGHFQDVWKDSLSNMNEGQSNSIDNWSNLMDRKPNQSDILAPLVTSIGDSSREGNPIQLLQWMYHYEQMMESKQ
ncbi:SPOR domain-containing protein [Oceanobacillus damuensis]|uniref:SPOR domain-containing protein n=1 Tax=Oceanobacillus damuensis TaxID=937928 RepID=UPI00082B454F|nr:SPOR domain-containing protein [Oceanobacillus damuensis]